MNHPWVICLAREDAASLAGLRRFSGIEVGEAVSGATEIWLRGQGTDDRLAAKLAALPAIGRYEWMAEPRPGNLTPSRPSPLTPTLSPSASAKATADRPAGEGVAGAAAVPRDIDRSAPGELRKIGHRIPGGSLPSLAWQPLEKWLQVEISTLALPGNPPSPVALRLVRSSREEDPELLLVDLPALAQFVAMAPLVRLARLHYAVDDSGQALVRGRPLPPLSGRRFVLHGSVAVPAGFAWEPAVGVDVLERCFGATGGALVVWNEDGTITRLHTEQFVPVSRSGLRETSGVGMTNDE